MPAARVSALDDFGAIRCSAVASLLTTARTLPLTMLTIPFFLQPREALLKYAKMGEEDPQWTAGACMNGFAREEKELTQTVLVHQQIDCSFFFSSSRTLAPAFRRARARTQHGGRISPSRCSLRRKRVRRKTANGWMRKKRKRKTCYSWNSTPRSSIAWRRGAGDGRHAGMHLRRL